MTDLRETKLSRNRTILNMAVPAMFALLAEPLLGVVDTALIGHFGVRELAALGIVTPFMAMVVWLFSFLLTSTNATVANFVGEGDLSRAASFWVQCQVIAVGIGVSVCLLGMVLEGAVFAVMGGSDSLRELSSYYYCVRLLGVPFALSGFVSIGFLRGLQDMKIPMVVALAVNLLNALLDVILIYGVDGYVPAYGLAGAGVATACCQGLGALWLASLVYRRCPDVVSHFKTPFADSALIRRMFSINRDLFVRTFSLLFSFTFAASMASRIGEVTLGAHQVGTQAWIFLAFALDSFAVTGLSLGGRLMGEDRKEELHAYGKLLLVWGVGLGCIFSGLLALFENQIIALFTNDAGVAAQVGEVYLLVVLFQPLNGFTFVLDGLLVGTLDTRFLMVQLLIAAFAVYVPMAAAAYMLDWGLYGIWWGLTLFLAARCGLSGWRFFTRGYLGGKRAKN